MDLIEFRDFCLSLPETTESMPFGDDVLVLKVCGKMFALCDIEKFESINLKCDPIKAIELREDYPGIVNPGYHMNKKHWNTIEMNSSISNRILKKWILDSYRLVITGLPKSISVPLIERLSAFEQD